MATPSGSRGEPVFRDMDHDQRECSGQLLADGGATVSELWNDSGESCLRTWLTLFQQNSTTVCRHCGERLSGTSLNVMDLREPPSVVFEQNSQTEEPLNVPPRVLEDFKLKVCVVCRIVLRISFTGRIAQPNLGPERGRAPFCDFY